MVLSHSYDEEYIPHIQTQFSSLQLVIVTSCPFAMVSVRESDPISSKSSLWIVKDGNWIPSTTHSLLQTKQTPFPQQLLAPLVL